MPPQPLRENVRYVGAPVERTLDAAWRPSWPADDPRPLVLVGLSTLRQGQGPVMQRVIEAVGTLPVRALVTLGPSLDRSEFVAPPNAVIEAFVPHDVVMPLAAVMVTQCGLGTLAKALAFGAPAFACRRAHARTRSHARSCGCWSTRAFGRGEAAVVANLTRRRCTQCRHRAGAPCRSHDSARALTP
jgi:hypothetical protein